MVGTLFKFPKVVKDVARIIKIAEKIEADGPKKRRPSQQSGLSRSMSPEKYTRNLGHETNIKDKQKV